MTPTLAAIRFGTGLSPDIAAPRDGEDVLARLAGPDEMAATYPQDDWAPRVADALLWIRARQRRRKEKTEAAAAAYRDVNRRISRNFHADLGRALSRGARTRDGFRERLMWFWSDHFTVEHGRGLRRGTVPAYHEEAVRPHLGGTFGAMLIAAVKHPAMLDYLDQTRSAGPNSSFGRHRGGGLNENLAREVLELHTLGAGAAYTQGDVRELAELLTGLTVDKAGAFLFRPKRVEPGAEVVLGQSYGGERPNRHDIDRVLEDLAVHPATARHLSGKLAVHFVADAPPPDLIDAMAAAWMRTGGDLMAVYGAMLDHPAAWAPALRKVRRPMELVVATVRALDQGRRLHEAGNRVLRTFATAPMGRMGQSWGQPGGPDGWPEAAEEWITPQTLAARLGWAVEVAEGLAEPPDPRAWVDVALGPLASPRLRFAAEAAEDRAAGIALILASPEFNRR